MEFKLTKFLKELLILSNLEFLTLLTNMKLYPIPLNDPIILILKFLLKLVNKNSINISNNLANKFEYGKSYKFFFIFNE